MNFQGRRSDEKGSGLTEDDEMYLRSALPGWLYIDTRHEVIEMLKVNNKTHKFEEASMKYFLTL